jgi:hydroxypyruvate isomerase
MLFNEVGFLDRFAEAATAGFSGVEYLFPYEYDRQQLRQLLDEHRLVQVLHNLPAGNWAAGERGIACHPERTAEFAAGVNQAIEYATALGCTQVNCLAGIVPAGRMPLRRARLRVEPARGAASRVGRDRTAIEPINTRDVWFLPVPHPAGVTPKRSGPDNGSSRRCVCSDGR